MTNEELVTRIRAGETALYEELYNQNRGIIYKACRQYGNPAEYEDLLQECFFALHDAVRLYEEGSGKFVSYLWAWLKQHIIRYQQNNGYAIRIPVNQHEKVRAYKAVIAKYRREFGRYPEPEEVSAAVGLDTEELERLQDAAAALEIRSLNTPVTGGNEDGNPSELQELLPDDHNNIDDYIRSIEQEETAAELWATVDAIGATKADCIRMQYREGLTLEAIGAKIGVSSAAVQQRIESGLRQLRKPEYTKRLAPFLEDYAYNRGLKAVGVSAYQRTGTSATEYAALKLIELEDRLNYGFSEL